jgi:protein-S-isoprenylcysteine O-methyltransferase Ste14
MWVFAFSAFGWGVVRFFERRAGLRWRTAIVALFGLAFGAWHAVAIGTAAVGTSRSMIAIGLLAGSIALFRSAVVACGGRTLTAIFERDLPRALVQSGPYRLIRHPFYASYMLFWFAGWIASASTAALVSAFVMLAVYAGAIRAEERKFAASSLASEYAIYRRSAGAMTPRFQTLAGWLRAR